MFSVQCLVNYELRITNYELILRFCFAIDASVCFVVGELENVGDGLVITDTARVRAFYYVRKLLGKRELFLFNPDVIFDYVNRCVGSDERDVIEL